MRTRQLGRVWMLISIAVLISVGIARADFVLFEDFDGLIPGPIDDQNGWVAASASSAVASDPAFGENQVLSVITESTHLHKAMLIPNGTVRMLFLRFRFADQLNFSLGMSGQSYPTQFGDFEPELSLSNATSELRINDGGSYEVLTVVEANVWYNCWMLINNLTDSTEVWLHSRPGDTATAGDQLDADGQTLFNFRSGSAADLVSFFIKTGGGSGLVGPLYIDDIYLEDTDGLNLSNPAPVFASVEESGFSARGRVELAPSYPNPFNPKTTIHYTLPEDGQVRLTVFSVEGRQVATLADGWMPAGRHEVTWHGLDDQGLPAPSGVYFYRLDAGEYRDTKRMVLIK